MMTDAVAPGHAAAIAKWRALLGDPHHSVSCNLRMVLQLALEHAEELRTADGLDVVRLDDGDDASNFLRVDLGVLTITENVAGEITVQAPGEEVFAANASGPIRGRWGAWLVTLVAITRHLEERFGRPGRGHLH
jgi:hypothetical protein